MILKTERMLIVKPIVYVDMLFLLNFLMDSVIIYATGLLVKKAIHIPRMILSATISALYSAIMFFPRVSFLYSVFFKIIFLVLSVWLAFPARTLKVLVKNTIMFLAVNLIFGGMVFVVIFVTDFGTAVGSVVSNGEVYINITPSVLISSTVLAYIVAYITSYIKQHNIKQSKLTTPATIWFGTKNITVTTLCDTGCSLSDPISGYPAMIISHEDGKELLPKSFFESLTTGGIIPQEFKNRYRIIPFSTIDNRNGIMHGFIPDKVYIHGHEISKTVIAVSKTLLNSDTGFSAILNPELLTTCPKETERQETKCQNIF